MDHLPLLDVEVEAERVAHPFDRGTDLAGHG
jgi:hypothetical protein